MLKANQIAKHSDPQYKRQYKDRDKIDQYKRVFAAFFNAPKTMKMVDKETGIMRENICWYCRTMRKHKLIVAVKRAICPITKHVATYYTTNPEHFPIDNQLKLFKD